MKRIVVFGSTGFIGRKVLEVVDRFGDRFKVVGLGCRSNVDLMRRQVEKFKPEAVYIKVGDLKTEGIRCFSGDNWKEFIDALDFDLFISASSGSSGFLPTYYVLGKNKKVALANKETLVMGGLLIRPFIGNIIPVDSEHSSLFRLLQFMDREYVKSIILTASGGPFLDTPQEKLKNVTPDEAVRHPNWPMGKKISVDSATLMNKGLEVIEAHFLFDFPPDAIKVVIHRQSYIHAMVETLDGTLFAHSYPPDMKIPIAYALFYPDMPPTLLHSSELIPGYISFDVVDEEKFPSLSLCYWALKEGGIMPVVLNAANEEAVYGFLEGKLGFNDIVPVVEKVLNMVENHKIECVEDVLEADRKSRDLAREIIKKWRH